MQPGSGGSRCWGSDGRATRREEGTGCNPEVVGAGAGGVTEGTDPGLERVVLRKAIRRRAD